MTNIFFTSDTHLGHDNICTLCNRPFGNVAEMDETIISNWNTSVKKGDIVYHLGDFAWASYPKDVEAYLKRLNGQIHLILGNHDRIPTKRSKGFTWIGERKIIKVGEQTIVLDHYAGRVWYNHQHGTWQLYGHSHGKLSRDWTVKALDVGVDSWDFSPLSYDEVADQMKLHATSRTGVRPRRREASAQS